MSAKGSRHMERVAGLPCVLCKATTGQSRYGVHVHHIREGQGAAQRADDMLTVALCPSCHQGPNGVHGLGRKGFYARYKLDELDLLAMTLEALET
jgi:hypothetical protein